MSHGAATSVTVMAFIESVTLEVADLTAAGLAVAKSFGRKYVEFATAPGSVKLALYGRRAAAKDAGVSPEGTGSHRLMISGDTGPFTDPDGFAWEAASLEPDAAAQLHHSGM